MLVKKINISCLGILLGKAISTRAGGSTVSEVSVRHIVAGGELVANNRTCVLHLGASPGIYEWHGSRVGVSCYCCGEVLKQIALKVISTNTEVHCL